MSGTVAVSEDVKRYWGMGLVVDDAGPYTAIAGTHRVFLASDYDALRAENAALREALATIEKALFDCRHEQCYHAGYAYTAAHAALTPAPAAPGEAK